MSTTPVNPGQGQINPLTAAIIALVGGAAGAFPTPTSQKTDSSTSGTSGNTLNQTSSGTSQTDSFQNYLKSLTGGTTSTGTVTPNLSPETQALLSKLTGSFSNLAKPVDLSGYQAQQTAGINKNTGLQQQSLANIMAARGLASSPAAGTAQAGTEAQRFSAITGLNQSLPVLQNTLTRENLGAAGNFFAQIPKGATTTQAGTSFSNEAGGQYGSSTGTTSATGTSTGSGFQTGNAQSSSLGSAGGGIGGGLGGFAALLAALAKQTNLGNIFKTIGASPNTPPVIDPSGGAGPGPDFGG